MVGARSITRERAFILLSCAVAVSSIFVAASLWSQVATYQEQVEVLQSNLNMLESGNEVYRVRVDELEDRVAELQVEAIRNSKIVDTWRTYRDRLEEAYVENARLKGLLLEREVDEENFTAPTVRSRKETYHIGETIAFIIESEVPLYGSYFSIWDSDGILVWEGDPLGNWVEVEGLWITPFYDQTAYLEPMILGDDMPLGDWTWSYRFSDIVYIEGAFTVVEPYEGTLPGMD